MKVSLILNGTRITGVTTLGEHDMDNLIEIDYDPITIMESYAFDGTALRFVGPYPSPHHIYDFGTASWIDPRPIEEVRAAQWRELKSARDAFEFGGFDWSGHRFDSDQISQQRIGNVCLKALVAQGAGIPFSEDWTLADNSVLSGITPEQMLSIGMAMGAHVSSAHEKYRLLKAQIEAALTVEDVTAITWPSAA